MSTHNVLVIGCGWLGKEVALLALRNGHNVLATTRSEESASKIKEAGISGTTYLLGDAFNDDMKSLENPSIVISIPPSKSKAYITCLRATIDEIKGSYKKFHLSFCSSTGYYPSKGSFTENYVGDEASSSLVYAAENQLADRLSGNYCTLRLGGLFNTSDRHPGNWFKGKKELANGGANMLHQLDAAGAIVHAIEKGATGIYNIVNPSLCSKKVFYEAAFKHVKREPIKVIDKPTQPGKYIYSSRVDSFGYKYQRERATDYFKA